MRITEIIWKQRFADKLAAKHSVSIAEAEEALTSRGVFRRVARGRVKGQDLYAAMAQIASGRYLIVFFIDKGSGVALPISARDMDRAEKRYYGKRR